MTHHVNLLFSQEELLHSQFLQTDLGHLYLAIPFEKLASTIPSAPNEKSGKGCTPWFDVKGGIALQFLKHYLRSSDAMLIKRINTDWSMQLFCGISLKPGEQIKDEDLPSRWRSYLGKYMDIQVFQKELARSWKPYIESPQIGMQDATCYESYIEYPTDVKLLWRCCEKLYDIIQKTRKKNKFRKTRCNFKKQQQQYLDYSKRRKKSRRLEKKMRKKVLNFLLRLITLYNEFIDKYKVGISVTHAAKMQTIIKVYEQQHQHLFGEATEQIKNRIVSLSKPYIRPIVRGKEVKPVEFGAKVNKLQVDGISFIEHISFDAFNETTRYTKGIHLQRTLFGKCTHQGADAIYATNKNRSYSTQQKIQTNFVPKGKEKESHKQQASQIRGILNKQRATVLEGSFGNEKNHYLLNKIKARSQPTEICWIFFGMMAANASIIAQRMKQQNQTRAA